MRDNKILLYHAGCPDGFGAAWAFWNKYGDTIQYAPVSHGKEPPDIEGLDVYIADFCYKKDILLSLKDKAKSLVVLDHHKSAEKECGDLEFCHFDMNHSGALLAWNYLFPDTEAPLLLRYIEDRDLWRWKLDSAEEILSAVDSYDRTFDNWDMLDEKLDSVGSPSWLELKFVGEGILRYKNSLIDSLIKNQYEESILGRKVPCINVPFFQSEIASRLAANSEYAAAYYYDGEAYKFSLRSRDGGADVSLIAGNFKGGGHKNASGFRIASLDDLPKGVTDE